MQIDIVQDESAVSTPPKGKAEVYILEEMAKTASLGHQAIRRSLRLKYPDGNIQVVYASIITAPA